jgi:hypothetical protein
MLAFGRVLLVARCWRWLQLVFAGPKEPAPTKARFRDRANDARADVPLRGCRWSALLAVGDVSRKMLEDRRV